MAEWTKYKGEGPWDFTKQPDRLKYNEGSLIATSDDPTWEYPNQFGGTPVTVVHHPGCGYWHKHKVAFLTNTGFYTEFDAEHLTITITDDDFSGPYTWYSGDGTFENATTDGKINVLEIDDVCNKDEISFTVTNKLGETISETISNESLNFSWVTSLETYISSGNPVLLEISGGVGPYSWGVVGTGASLSTGSTTVRTNLLSSTAEGCGTFVVTVTDFCGASITLNVLNVTGSYNDYCYYSEIGYDGWTYHDDSVCTYEWSGYIFYANGWKNYKYECIAPQDKDVGPITLYCAGEYIASYYRCDEAPCRPQAYKSYKWGC